MNASEAKNPPDPVSSLPVSNLRSEALRLQLQNFSGIVSTLREHSKAWKAMNAGESYSSWRRRWKAAQESLETLRGLSEPSPNLAVSG